MKVTFDKESIKVDESFLKRHYRSFLNPKINLQYQGNQGNTVKIQNLVRSIDWVYSDRSALIRHLSGYKLPELVYGKNNNFNKLVALLNLAVFNQEYGSYYLTYRIINDVKTYFSQTEVPADLNLNRSQQEIYGILYHDLQVIWFFPQFRSILIHNITISYIHKIWQLVQKDRSNGSQSSFGSSLINSIISGKGPSIITEEMFYSINNTILDKFRSFYPTENQLLNAFDCDKLNFLPKGLLKYSFQKELGYQESEPISFNSKILQQRMQEYSDNILNSQFPFDPSRFVIAGGFPTNVICGLRSIYTDLDFYIYKDFQQTCQDIINHLSKSYQIELTYNSCIINVILVGHKMNLQLIKSKEVGQEVIQKFDLTHSQAMITDWNHLEITHDAYHAYLTGNFEINSNVRINQSRILKAYIKGFQIDKHSIRKAINTKIDEDAKTILNDLKATSLPEQVIRKYLPKDSVNFKILTKAIHLNKNIYETLSKNGSSIKEYLEKETTFKYLKIEDIPKHHFRPLEIYGSKYYGYDYTGQNDPLEKVLKFVRKPSKFGKNLIQLNLYDLKAQYLSPNYSNGIVEKDYYLTTVIDPNAMKMWSGQLYLTLSANHPLVKTLLKIEEKMKKDFQDDLKGLKLRSSAVSIKNKEAWINLKSQNISNINLTNSENKIESFPVPKAFHDYNYKKFGETGNFYENLIEKKKPDLLMITLSLKNLHCPKENPTEYSYTIALHNQVKIVKKKPDTLNQIELLDQDD